MPCGVGNNLTRNDTEICSADILDRRSQEHIYHADGTEERRILCSYEKNVAHRKHGMTQKYLHVFARIFMYPF